MRRLRFRSHDGQQLPFVRRHPTTTPILPVDDMAAAMAFYEQLGFDVKAYDDGYAWVRHCGWEWLHLRRVDSAAGNEASAYLHVEDAQAWREAMVRACGGSVELEELDDKPWGKREYSFVDPAGNLVRLGSSV